MRLGGPVFGDFDDPDGWVAALKDHGYGAAFCPVRDVRDVEAVRAYAEAAEKAGVVIAEVGAFGNNPISPDTETRRAGIAVCQQKLALADQIGARCCVNVAGSRGDTWAGPHADNLMPETFDLIVASVREIIDGVGPTRAFYTLEMMPWMYPDSPENCLDLVNAVDRKQFAVHLDPVNIVCSPQRYYTNGALIRDCFRQLRPYIKSCHAKDIALSDKLTVHLDEVRPGLGGLDYHTFLQELDKLSPDTPLMLEHLRGAEQYALAADHIRSVAREMGVKLKGVKINPLTGTENPCL